MDEKDENIEGKDEPIEGTVIEEKDSKDTKEEKNKFSEETEKIKNETKETVNTVKETIKNANFKKNADETKSFVKEMFFNPFEAVRRAANEENILIKVIILMCVFIVANVIYTIIYLLKEGSSFGFGQNFLSFTLSFLKPVIIVLVPSIIIWVFSGDNRKKLITVISTVVVAYIPIIANTILSILVMLINKLSLIVDPISIALYAVSIILLYFGYKELAGKGSDESDLGKFAIIILISEFVLTLLSEINIY